LVGAGRKFEKKFLTKKKIQKFPDLFKFSIQNILSPVLLFSVKFGQTNIFPYKIQFSHDDNSEFF